MELAHYFRNILCKCIGCKCIVFAVKLNFVSKRLATKGKKNHARDIFHTGWSKKESKNLKIYSTREKTFFVNTICP